MKRGDFEFLKLTFMNNRLKTILKIIILILIVFVVTLTINKFYGNRIKAIDKVNNVGYMVKYDHKINYTDTYKENIITDIVTEIEYSVVSGNDVLYGKFFIGTDKKLYITNKLSDKKYLVLDKKMKTLYLDKKGINNSYVYGLTEEGIIYYVGLFDANISSLFVEEIPTPSSVSNFTNLNINSFIGDASGIVVLLDDEKMYYTKGMIGYSDSILNVLDNYIVYPDGIITNIYGNALVDSNNNLYVAKNIILANEPIKELKYNPTLIIITEDNRLIYLIDDTKTFEYGLKVNFVVLDDNNNIKIIFEDSSELVFSGYYNQKYYPILFEKE